MLYKHCKYTRNAFIAKTSRGCDGPAARIKGNKPKRTNMIKKNKNKNKTKKLYNKEKNTVKPLLSGQPLLTGH